MLITPPRGMIGEGGAVTTAARGTQAAASWAGPQAGQYQPLLGHQLYPLVHALLTLRN